MTDPDDRTARQARYRAALLEEARAALRRLEQQLDQPGGSQVVGDVSVSGDPNSLTIRVEVPLDGRWVTLVRLSPADIGVTAEDVADDVRLLRYQSGVGIPDDLSGLDESDSGGP